MTLARRRGPDAFVPAAGEGLLRVVAVDVGGRFADAIERALASNPERERFSITSVSELGPAIELLAESGADAVLLSIAAGEDGLVPLVTLLAEVPTVPVIVLCAAPDEPLAAKAVQLGASDYLVAERLYGTLLARSLRHAIEVERVRAILAQRQAEWPPSLGGGGGSRPAALRVAFPDAFTSLVQRYLEVLVAAVEAVLHRRPPPVEERLQEIGLALTELRAGPRDVVELHAAAMKRCEAEQGAQRMQLFLAEGRVRLLELMGHLVTCYRDRWLAGTRQGSL